MLCSCPRLFLTTQQQGSSLRHGQIRVGLPSMETGVQRGKRDG